MKAFKSFKKEIEEELKEDDRYSVREEDQDQSFQSTETNERVRALMRGEYNGEYVSTYGKNSSSARTEICQEKQRIFDSTHNFLSSENRKNEEDDNNNNNNGWNGVDYLKDTEEIPVVKSHLAGEEEEEDRESIDSIFGKIEKAVKETRELI